MKERFFFLLLLIKKIIPDKLPRRKRNKTRQDLLLWENRLLRGDNDNSASSLRHVVDYFSITAHPKVFCSLPIGCFYKTGFKTKITLACKMI